MDPLLDSTSQGVEHLRYLGDLGQRLGSGLLRQIRQVSAECDQIFRLCQGTLGNIDESSELLVAEPFRPLRNVRWNRDGRTAELRSNPETFGVRKAVRQVIDFKYQRMAPLPDLQILKALQVDTSFSS